jgi:hypothetical protein
VSGDTVVVGAYLEDSNATGVNGNQTDNSARDSGAAYVFVRNAGVWSEQAYLKASNTEASDEFGLSVGVSGDTVVVGASRDDSNATGVNGNQSDNSGFECGAAYVFVRNAGVWSQQAYLKASNTENGDQFGVSVAVSGDTVVVGAFGEDSSATGVNGNQSDNRAQLSGATYVFVRNAGVWIQQAYLKASNTGETDLFGSSVAVSGDTAVVGAYFEDSDATGVHGIGDDNRAQQSGASYVFLISSRIEWECTGCYFLSNNLRATLAFRATVEGASGTFSYQYRSATQTVQFTSTTMTQVQVSGDRATFSGQGILNGQAGYQFLIGAIDGGPTGAGQDSVSVIITGPNYSYAAAGTIVGGDIVVMQ